MAVSKRLRYEVLRRDNHTCRYCGASAPDVKLTVDHVTPVALGGRDEAANLVTACQPCNSGKTSTTPDAPLVDDVAADALRWAQALRVAADQMLADLEARERVHANFEKQWNNWGVGKGDDRTLVPKPAGWRDTVDHLISVGLPWPVLAECIEKAMTRDKVKLDEKFRYMCGIAWNKVTELQDAARAHAAAPSNTPPPAGGDPNHDPRLIPGRMDFAMEVLRFLYGEEEIPHRLAEMTEDGEEMTDPERVMTAGISAVYAWDIELRRREEEVANLGTAIEDLLRLHSVRLVDDARAVAREQQLTGANYLVAVARQVAVQESEALLRSLPQDEAAEWTTYTEAWFGREIGDQDAFMTTAAFHVRLSQDGLRARTMCAGPGRHITRCPRRATYTAFLNEHDGPCCAPNSQQRHGHGFCDDHMQQVVDGRYVNSDGALLTARDFEPREASDL